MEPAAPSSGAAPGSGAEVQSLATLLWGLTPATTLLRGLTFISILHQTTTSECSGCTGQPLSFISILHQTTTCTITCGAVPYYLLSLFYIKPQRTLQEGEPLDIVFYLYSTSNHNVYFLILLFTDICVHSYVHEVVKTYYLLCKITKKILTAMGLALIFSLWLPKCE